MPESCDSGILSKSPETRTELEKGERKQIELNMRAIKYHLENITPTVEKPGIEKLRPASERLNLLKTRELSRQNLIKSAQWKSPKGELFVYENGDLTEYTDTRVINHENDRIVNLAENPFQD